MNCKNCLAKSSNGCTVGVAPYYLRSGNLGCAWNARIIQKHMNDLKPKTRFDWIKSLSAEELAEYLSDIAGWLPEYEGKAHALLKWLKATVKEVDE